MAQPKIVVRQRTQEWFQEEGELSPAEYAAQLLREDRARAQGTKKPLNEKYDTNRFQPGWNGKDAPAVEKMGSGYAKKGDGTRDFSDLGASAGKKTSKGSVGKVTVDDIKEAQRILAIAKAQSLNEELLDDEFDDDMSPENGAGPDGGDGFNDDFGDAGDDGMDAGLAGEDDVPPEMGDEGFEGGDEGIADDVTVNIGGQEFVLTPAPEDDMGGEMGGDMGGEGGFDDADLEGDAGFDGGDEFGGEVGGAGPDAGMGDEGQDDELIRHGGVKAENKDITRERKGQRVKENDYDKILDEAIKNARAGKAPARKITKEQLVKHHLQIKAMLEKNHKIAVKKLHELFTGEYVLNKQGEPGYDFSPVGGDESFAVVARAASGDQYSPTISKSVWEPDKKGGKTGHAKTVTEDFKAWLTKMQKSLAESDKDPGEDSDHFNTHDTLVNNLSGGGADEFAKVPELIGKDKDTISQYGEAQKRLKARRQQEAEQAIKFPSPEVKEDLEKNLNESAPKGFDFKALMAGKY